jgi:hypothetical protein
MEWRQLGTASADESQAADAAHEQARTVQKSRAKIIIQITKFTTKLLTRSSQKRNQTNAATWHGSNVKDGRKVSGRAGKEPGR